MLLTEDIVPGKDVRIRVLGQLEKIPRGLRNLSLDIMRKTEDYTDYTFNLMLGYGGRYELVQAVNKLIAEGNPVTVDNFSQALYLTSEPDLIIRTGDTHRLSGFMPWQSTYSELYFTKQLWPGFTKADFETAINEFHARSRTFGV